MIISTIKKILFDDVCFLCGSKKNNEIISSICNDCLKTFNLEEKKLCKICGHPNDSSDKCISCDNIEKIYYDDFKFIQYYTGYFRNILHMLKLRENFLVIKLFYELLIVKKLIDNDGILTVVPDNFIKKVKKGRSSLSYLLYLLKKNNFSINDNIFYKRIFNGKSQKLKIKNKRINEIEKKYYLPKRCINKFSGKAYLIDDIYTTGSTLNYGAKLLKMAGFSEVVIVTFFRARLFHN